ncbi:MAG: hypothetical protein JZD40_00320, partial [Sulfolobus sp.]|nr:hypothetical protein [Sulfolobus sp.]
KRVELSTIRQRILELRNQISEKVKIYQQLKNERDSVLKEIQSINDQINELVNKNNDLKNKINEKKDELKKYREQLKKIKEMLKSRNFNEAYEQQLKNMDKEVIENKRKKAEEKLKNNKRLTFDELLILYYNDKDSNEQDSSNIR